MAYQSNEPAVHDPSGASQAKRSACVTQPPRFFDSQHDDDVHRGNEPGRQLLVLGFAENTEIKVAHSDPTIDLPRRSRMCAPSPYTWLTRHLARDGLKSNRRIMWTASRTASNKSRLHPEPQHRRNQIETLSRPRGRRARKIGRVQGYSKLTESRSASVSAVAVCSA